MCKPVLKPKFACCGILRANRNLHQRSERLPRRYFETTLVVNQRLPRSPVKQSPDTRFNIGNASLQGWLFSLCEPDMRPNVWQTKLDVTAAKIAVSLILYKEPNWKFILCH